MNLGDPLENSEQVSKINHDIYNGQLTKHHNSTDAYLQSHPYSYMYTAFNLATDEATLNSNYMRAVFGGDENEKDFMHMAYKNTLNQLNEAPSTRVLHEFSPSDFVEGTTSSKDSLLDTFASTREYYKGQLDTEVERSTKARAGHELTQVVFYGKNENRFHHLTGQQSQFKPSNLVDFTPSLSSRNYAPDGNGGFNNLFVTSDDVIGVSLA